MTDPKEVVSHGAADFVYDAFYTGAIGGSLVALFFLAVDGANGQPLYTPSLMGSVLFGDVAAESVTSVRLDMVALYTLVHFASFALLGAAVSVAVHETELHARHPIVVLAAIFVVFEAAFALGASLLMPGVVGRIGVLPIAGANLLAAAGIGSFLLGEHRPGAWDRFKHAVHLT